MLIVVSIAGGISSHCGVFYHTPRANESKGDSVIKFWYWLYRAFDVPANWARTRWINTSERYRKAGRRTY